MADVPDFTREDTYVEELELDVIEEQLKGPGDPLKQWKLSPMDLESRRRWEAYTKAKEDMLVRTHTPHAPWWIVDADDKRRARLNCIDHLLHQLPYAEVPHESVTLPARVRNPNYLRGPIAKEMYVPHVY